jgi:hypothetical protein
MPNVPQLRRAVGQLAGSAGGKLVKLDLNNRALLEWLKYKQFRGKLSTASRPRTSME